MNNYDAHSAAQRGKRGAKAAALSDEEERLIDARKDHQEAVNTCGEMRGQAKVRLTLALGIKFDFPIVSNIHILYHSSPVLIF